MAVEGACEICAEPCHPQAYACRRCKKILDRPEFRKDPDGKVRRFDREARKSALKDAWDKEDKVFRCFYTQVALDTTDWRDHRYLSLEHQTPGDESNITVVSALVNRMKTDLSDDEFRRMVNALAESFAPGGKFDEAAFPDRHFRDEL
jgi:hypothetical protein